MIISWAVCLCVVVSAMCVECMNALQQVSLEHSIVSLYSEPFIVLLVTFCYDCVCLCVCLCVPTSVCWLTDRCWVSKSVEHLCSALRYNADECVFNDRLKVSLLSDEFQAVVRADNGVVSLSEWPAIVDSVGLWHRSFVSNMGDVRVVMTQFTTVTYRSFMAL